MRRPQDLAQRGIEPFSFPSGRCPATAELTCLSLKPAIPRTANARVQGARGARSTRNPGPLRAVRSTAGPPIPQTCAAAGAGPAIGRTRVCRARRSKPLRRFTEYGERKTLRGGLPAGAAETGAAAGTVLLASETGLESRRRERGDEASPPAALTRPTIPGRRGQEAFLFPAACEPKGAPAMRAGTRTECRHCRGLIPFLRGEAGRLGNVESATFVVLARRACGCRILRT